MKKFKFTTAVTSFIVTSVLVFGFYTPTNAYTEYGLDYPLNYVAGGDIRLVWDGANLLPRNNHTAIWKAKYKQQVTTYYAVAWHSVNTGTWDFGVYNFGTHPYPAATGTYDGSGFATAGDAGASGNYFMEMAGAGSAVDKIAIPMEPAMKLEVGRWYTQARTASTSGSNTIHRFYPDLDNFPSLYIERTTNTASIGTPADPAFYLGASDWTTTFGDQNSETPGAVIRHVLLYDRALSQAEIEAKADLTTNDTTDPDIWYSNIDPTPTDITDKSGAGRTPTWDNANRPALFTGSTTPDAVLTKTSRINNGSVRINNGVQRVW